MKFVALLLAASLFVSTASGEIVYLEKGVKTPFAGFLLDKEAQVYVNTKMAENEARDAAIISQNDLLINVQKQKINLEIQTELLQEQLDSKNTWTKVLYFIGGVVAGGLVTKAIGK